MKVSPVTTIVLFMPLAACTRPDPAPELRPESDRFSATVPANGLQLVRIKGHDGNVRVTVGDRTHVDARAALSQLECAVGSVIRTLRSRRQGVALDLEIAPTTKGDCEEAWVIELPEHLGVEVDMDRADVDVRGIAGGVDLAIGKGTITIDVPEGSIRAKAEHGDVRVTTQTPSYGRVTLESTVGGVSLSIDGGAVDHNRPPGSGDRVSVNGAGRDRITLQATLGDVRLAIRGALPQGR